MASAKVLRRPGAVLWGWAYACAQRLRTTTSVTVQAYNYTSQASALTLSFARKIFHLTSVFVPHGRNDTLSLAGTDLTMNAVRTEANTKVQSWPHSQYTRACQTTKSRLEAEFHVMIYLRLRRD
jgi:hypothetical protein